MKEHLGYNDILARNRTSARETVKGQANSTIVIPSRGEPANLFATTGNTIQSALHCQGLQMPMVGVQQDTR